MKQFCLLFAAMLMFGVTAGAQQKAKPYMIGEDGPMAERGLCRVLYWSPQKDTALGQFAISFGRPLWKKEYGDPAKFDPMTKGKIWRLGKDFWTTLDTDVPLKIGSREIMPGTYYLGLSRSQDGASWSLSFIDPAKVRSMRLDAFQIERAPILFQVPVSFKTGAALTDKLTIGLSYPKENPKNVRLTIAWGQFRLAAAILATVQ